MFLKQMHPFPLPYLKKMKIQYDSVGKLCEFVSVHMRMMICFNGSFFFVMCLWMFLQINIYSRVLKFFFLLVSAFT